MSTIFQDPEHSYKSINTPIKSNVVEIEGNNSKLQNNNTFDQEDEEVQLVMGGSDYNQTTYQVNPLKYLSNGTVPAPGTSYSFYQSTQQSTTRRNQGYSALTNNNDEKRMSKNFYAFKAYQQSQQDKKSSFKKQLSRTSSSHALIPKLNTKLRG